MLFSLHKKSAFSLIELLVSVSILLLIIGGALAGYTQYTNRQRLEAATEELLSAYKTAQNLALTGRLPDNCDKLAYSNLQVWNGGSPPPYLLRYRVRVVCENGNRLDIIPTINLRDFQINQSISGANEIRFFPLGYLNNSITRTITCTRSNYQATITIDKGGEIKIGYQ